VRTMCFSKARDSTGVMEIGLQSDGVVGQET